jgi:hypothetical protein
MGMIYPERGSVTMTIQLMQSVDIESLDLASLVYEPISDLATLRKAAQLAVKVEFTTIPAYLTGLYSISDRTSDAYQALRSVVIEEMFHVNQAANILVAIGGAPQFTGAMVPTYPSYLPSASTSASSPLPYVVLAPATRAVFRNVYMAIETPAPWNAPAQGDNYQTIGQLYKALWDGLENCVTLFGESAVFQPQAEAEQRADIYLGKFGGKVLEVTDLASAQMAIQQIVAQGEGAVNDSHPLVPSQPYGAYEHYGMRTDGTYGPILGTPYELSHYYKFLTVSNAPTLPETLPIISNPKISDFANAKAAHAAHTFNLCYSVMLNALQQSFTASGTSRDLYFKFVLPMMHSQLPALANYLMNTPALSHGDASVGPNAAPTFEYIAGATMDAYIHSLDNLQSGTRAKIGVSAFELPAESVVQAVPQQSSVALAGLHPGDSTKEEAIAMALGTAQGLRQLAITLGFDL